MSDFPTSLPSFTDLDGNLTLAANSHADRHNKVHDEIAAVAAKVGIDSSADTGSIDYKVATHTSNTSNPHSVTKSQIGLSNVDNTSDATKLAATLLAVYPIGSIYISVNSTNPGTLFGGTWVAFATGRTLVGIDTGQTEFDTVEETGGAKTHTLTTAEMPAHNHRLSLEYGGGVDPGQPPTGQYTQIRSNGTTYYNTVGGVTENTGGGGAHNNLQPYIVTYMWKRTA